MGDFVSPTPKRRAPKTPMSCYVVRKSLFPSLAGPEVKDEEQSSGEDRRSSLGSSSGSSGSGSSTPAPPEVDALTTDVENLSILSNLTDDEAPKRSERRRRRVKRRSTASKRRVVRITKSEKVFAKKHKYGRVMVAPTDNGSGCFVFASDWNGERAVTKLLPMFEIGGFTEDESLENAYREVEAHTTLYRLGCKKYGADECPVVPVWATVEVTHQGQSYMAMVMPRYDCDLVQFFHAYGALPTDTARDLLRAGTRFLTLLRELNIIHHDIKGENIFVAGDRDRVSQFAFADFGCSVSEEEEFPWGAITGTLTMWDPESLGAKYGDEDGCSKANDLFGVLQSFADALFGVSLVESWVVRTDPDWEDYDWREYTDAIRRCRQQLTRDLLVRRLRQVRCDDDVLCAAVLELVKPRAGRITLDQLAGMLGLTD